MKTQINTLRIGTQVQLLNSETDYSQLPRATGYMGISHAGSNTKDVANIWSKVLDENIESIKIAVFGEILTLKRFNSKSGKSSYFRTNVSQNFIQKNVGLVPSKDEKYIPFMQIELGNYVTIGNGKNAYTTICPSFVEILD